MDLFFKSKSDVFQTFTKFYHMINTQFQTQIKVIRSDSGGEYTSSAFSSFLFEKGHYSPQKKGIIHHNKMV